MGFFNQIIHKQREKKIVINSYHYKINVSFKIYNYIYINIMFCVNSSATKEMTKNRFWSVAKCIKCVRGENSYFSCV